MINLHVPGIDYRKGIMEAASARYIKPDVGDAFEGAMALTTLKKAALVWPPSAADTHAKGGGCLASPARAASPTSPGLAHWMSIMAEHPHMSNPHAPHDVHYMWNGVETKMNVADQSHGTPPMQKGHGGGGLDEGRPSSLESSQLHSMYGNHGTHARSSSSSSNSPPVSTAATSSPSMLVVPQPINAIAKQTINASAAAAVASAAANGSGRKYQCKMCPQIFMHKSAMQHHAREVHRGELKPHQCQQCLKSFSSNHQLVQHIRIHTGEKPYKCSYCDRRFKQLSHVQQHTRLHTGERPYKCHMPECGRAFIQLSNLQQHLRNHDSQTERAKNRPFHCNICGKGFATETSLRTHTSKQHAALIGGQNSQSCPVCHKLFLGNEALLDHMRTSHKDPNASGKRRAANHPCPVCGKTYVNEGSLRKHIASHPETTSVASPLRMWPCSVCQSVFTQESGLLSHMEHMRMDPKHQFAAQYVLSRAAAERRERENMISTGPGGRPPPPPPPPPLGALHPQSQGNERPGGGPPMVMTPGGGHPQPNP